MLKRVQNIIISPLFIIFLLLASLIVRRLGIPFISLDMQAGLFDWYGFILKRGFVNAFKEDFALYTPPYLYLLWFATLVDGIVSRVTLIKLISIIFDLVVAFFIFKITWLKYPRSTIPWLAAVVGFSLPTVILNSSYWGQCDSIYTAFLLGSLYFILIDRPYWTMFFFAISFAFKLQAVFFLPFLAVFTLRKRIPWLSYALVPLGYVAMGLPTMLAGRPWQDVLNIYLTQTDKFPKWSSTTPTMYLPLQGRVTLTPELSMAAVLLAGLVVAAWIWLCWKRKEKDSQNSIILAALGSVTLVPFMLPRMHQRYYYPQDLLSLVVAFFMPELWFLPVLSQVISVLSYSPFLFNLTIKLPLFGKNLNAILFVALPLEIILMGVVLWKQFHEPKKEIA